MSTRAHRQGSGVSIRHRVSERRSCSSSGPSLPRRHLLVREQRPTATGFEAMPDLPPQKKKDTVADRRKREGEERARRQAERWVERAQKKVERAREALAAPNPSSRTPAKSWKTRLAD